MAKKSFLTRKRLSLDFLGDEWKDCYIDFEPLRFKEVQQVQQWQVDESDQVKQVSMLYEFLESKFVSGKGFTDQGVVDLEKSDLQELPIEVTSKAMKALVGGVADPN